MNTQSKFNWDNLWRRSGNNFTVFAIIAYILYGFQPHVGASGEAFATFYGSHRMRILIATVISGLAILNLLWFAATLRAALVDAGRDGWGAAAIVSSSIIGGLFILLIAVDSAVTYSITGSGNSTLIPALKKFEWASDVMTSFPRAMFIMAGSFGLWRAGLISNKIFAAGVTAVVLVLLGGTTWSNEGIWSPDGAYSRFVSPVIGLVWVTGINQVLTKSPASRAAW